MNLMESYRVMVENADPFAKTASEHRVEAQRHTNSQHSAYAHYSSAKALDTGYFHDHDRAAYAHSVAAKHHTGEQADRHAGFSAWHRARAGSVNIAHATS